MLGKRDFPAGSNHIAMRLSSLVQSSASGKSNVKKKTKNEGKKTLYTGSFATPAAGKIAEKVIIGPRRAPEE